MSASRPSRRLMMMLVTSSSWWIKVGDDFWTLVTESRCWCPTLPTSNVKNSGCCWLKLAKPSPISYGCHQHISSPTSVTNIDVTSRRPETKISKIIPKGVKWTFILKISSLQASTLQNHQFNGLLILGIWKNLHTRWCWNAVCMSGKIMNFLEAVIFYISHLFREVVIAVGI